MRAAATIGALLTFSTSEIYFDDGSSISASDLWRRGAAMATNLSERLEPGDRIAIWIEPGIEYLELLAAAAAGGYVAVNVNNRYSDAEVSDLVKRSGAKILVSQIKLEAGSQCQVLSPENLQNLTGSSRTFEATSETPFTVFTTSGTTSKPKMVLHNHGGFARHSAEVVTRFGLSPETPVLVALPLCGVFGLNSFAAAVAANAPVWMASRFDAEAAGSLIAGRKIVAMNGSDDMFNRLLETDHDISSLQIAGYGAFNTSLEDLATQAESRGAKLSGLYGMSEVQALYAFADQSKPLLQRASAGGRLTSPDAAVRVVDGESGAVLGAGEVGELQLMGPSLFVGYLKEGGDAVDSALTASSYSDGWFKTGDLGSINADGSFTFIARMGDVLRLGGFLVAPLEIEEVILELPDIEEAQVVSISSSRGTRPVAFVIERSGYPQANQRELEAAIIDHCRARLAKFKCPIRVISIDAFPATDGPNGLKIQRGKLRQMATEMVTL